MRIRPISSHNGFVDPPANRRVDYANNTTRGGTIQTIGIPRAWSLVLASAVAALAGMVVFAMLHEMRSRPGQQVAPATSQRPEPRALTAEEERYAAALWEVHREVTPSAVAMSFAGIAYKTEMQDAHELARRIAPLAKFFTQAEARVGSLAVPASLSKVHGQYAEAMTSLRKCQRRDAEVRAGRTGPAPPRRTTHGPEGIREPAARWRGALAGTIQTALGCSGRRNRVVGR